MGPATPRLRLDFVPAGAPMGSPSGTPQSAFTSGKPNSTSPRGRVADLNQIAINGRVDHEWIAPVLTMLVTAGLGTSDTALILIAVVFHRPDAGAYDRFPACRREVARTPAVRRRKTSSAETSDRRGDLRGLAPSRTATGGSRPGGRSFPACSRQSLRHPAHLLDVACGRDVTSRALRVAWRVRERGVRLPALRSPDGVSGVVTGVRLPAEVS